MSFELEIEEKSNFLSPDFFKAMQTAQSYEPVSEEELRRKQRELLDKTNREIIEKRKSEGVLKKPELNVMLSDVAKKRMEEYDKRMEKGWWGKLSTPAKIGIIGGGVLTLGLITYLVVKR